MTDRQASESGSESRRDRLSPLWLARVFLRRFQVSDDRLAEILAGIRSQLPTTEAWLVGKTQAGKSSIVRGLTGASAAIVGQGFQPHTQNTARYAYPSESLPLLIFTDTVGLGDVDRDTATIAAELQTELQKTTDRARVLILVVKATDFATDSLCQVARQLRQQFPEVPCLLAVTCLHELYPPELQDHPSYPPQLPEVTRAIAAMEKTFAGLCDRCIPIDFTLEEDGFTPTFYGLEALQQALEELLPAAEANAIHQLLDREGNASLGNLYRSAGRHYVASFATIAGIVAAVPLPFATMPVLTALQVSLVGLLGKLYGKDLSPAQAGGVVSTIAGGFFAQAVGRELIKLVPIFGSAIAATWAAAYTWALGEAACAYFGELAGGKTPDPKRIQAAMRDAFQNARQQLNSADKPEQGDRSGSRKN